MPNETLLMDSPDDLLNKVKEIVKGETGEFPSWCQAMAIALIADALSPVAVAALIVRAMDELEQLELQASASQQPFLMS